MYCASTPNLTECASPETPEKPATLAVKLELLPAELQPLRRWVLWRLELKQGRAGQLRWAKVPYSAALGAEERRNRACSDDPHTWCRLEEVLCHLRHFDGLGVMLGGGLSGIDLDKCRDPATGDITEAAREVVAAVNSYTEVSPSGTGLKLLVNARKPEGRCRTAGFELYSEGRFFTLTGHHLPGTPLTIQARQDEVDRLHARMFPPPSAPARNGKPRALPPDVAGTGGGRADDDVSDAELLDRARSSKNGEKFSRLWDGDWQALGYPSQSEADEALAGLLAFWCGPDPQRIDRLFRRSALYRDKWDRDDYRRRTIERVLAGQGDYYAWRDDGLPELEAKALEVVRPVEAACCATQEVPEIIVSNRQLSDVTAEALAALRRANDPPRWFQRAGTLTRLRVDPATNAPSLEPLGAKAVRGVLARVARWKKVERRGDHRVKTDVIVPEYVAEDLLALPGWDLPPLKAVIEAPVFTPGGTLVATPGYDPGSMLWYQPAPGFTLPPVSPRPAAEEVGRARDLLLGELLVDFPFVGEASRANAVALLLLPFVRPLIDGPTPLHVIDAPTEGTGKDKLGNCFCVLATGREAQTNPECHGEEEWKKTITSLLSQGPAYVYWENVNYALSSAALTKVVSGRFHQDRLLGRNDAVRKVPVECVWLATGNNVRASRELTRRFVWVRLDALLERPDTRSGFKHVLPQWAKENRGRLVWACLTLIQAWVAGGMPKKHGVEPMGGFESWEGVMGGILDSAGVPGFLSNRSELFTEVNTTDAEWREFVSEWAVAHLTAPVGAAELYSLCQEKNLLPSVLSGSRATDDKARTHLLGLALARHKDQVYGGWRIERGEPDRHSKAQRYRLRQMATGAKFSSPDS
jgi:hypothetical protein